MFTFQKFAVGVLIALAACFSLAATAQNILLERGGLPWSGIKADTLFPHLIVLPDSFFVVIRPDTSLIRQTTIFNDGNDTLFFAIDANPGQWQATGNTSENMVGSHLSATPAAYEPGEAIDFVFSLYNGSSDNEWIDTLVVDFPQEVTVNFATNFIGGTQGPLIYNGTSGNGSPVNWNDQNGANGGNILPGETATSIVNISFGESLNDTLRIVYTISGDVHGQAPHFVTDTLVFLPEEIWLIASPDVGMVPPQHEQSVQLYFNSAGIPIGNYDRYFTIHSNDTTSPDLDIPVEMIVFPSSLAQTINIPAGWSGISAYVVPFHPEFETIFNNANDKIDVIQNIHSQLYWPDAFINTIGEWDTFDGYVIKAKEPFQIVVNGLFEISQTVLLYQGWNLMPALNYVPTSTFVLFRDIDDKIDIVNEIGGSKVYWPDQSIYTLTQLIPGNPTI